LIALKKIKVPYEVVPLPKRLNPATQLMADDLVVLSDSRHRGAALQFIRFAYQTKWRQRWTQLGMVPELRSILSSPDVKDDPVRGPFVSEMQSAHWVPIVPWARADHLISQYLHAFLAGRKTEQSVLYDMDTILSQVEKSRNNGVLQSAVSSCADTERPTR
ncbi:MAG: hypothetical protein ACREBW_06655, partial [Candidatus Micrarchaeaceae archaeon]